MALVATQMESSQRENNMERVAEFQLENNSLSKHGSQGQGLYIAGTTVDWLHCHWHLYQDTLMQLSQCVFGIQITKL